jgi:hypothetical protein
MNIMIRSRALGPACAAASAALATVCLILATPGCGGGTQRDAGSVSISKAKEAAAERGVAGPGERDGARGGRAGGD